MDIITFSPELSKVCQTVIKQPVEVYTRLLVFMKFAILPAVFHVINEKNPTCQLFFLMNEKFCQPCPFIQAPPTIRDLRVNLGNILNPLNNIKQINLFLCGQKAEKNSFDHIGDLAAKNF